MSHPDPEIQAIADRYGATVSPDLTVRHCHRGESAFGMVWDGTALVLQRPVAKGWGHPMGRPPKPVEVSGHRWPTQAACAAALGITPAAVSQAIRKGKLAALVARRLPAVKLGGVGDAA